MVPLFDAEHDVSDASTPSLPVEDGSAAQPAEDVSGDGGVVKRILKHGNAESGSPTAGCDVQVRYAAFLMDGSEVGCLNKIFVFRVERHATDIAVRGWDVGIQTMKCGEKAELSCRADYAYYSGGTKTSYGVIIPPDATIRYEIELISWTGPHKMLSEMTLDEKLAACNEAKAAGTRAYKQGDWGSARVDYLDAMRYLQDDLQDDQGGLRLGWTHAGYPMKARPDQVERSRELRISCLLNGAQCSAKLDEWPEVEAQCSSVLEIDGEFGRTTPNAKALYRRGVARTRLARSQEQYAAARSDLLEACKLEPKSTEIRKAFAECESLMKAKAADEREMYRKMALGAGGNVSKKEEAPAEALTLPTQAAAPAVEEAPTGVAERGGLFEGLTMNTS
jgi:hypothetical protein